MGGGSGVGDTLMSILIIVYLLRVARLVALAQIRLKRDVYSRTKKTDICKNVACPTTTSP